VGFGTWSIGGGNTPDTRLDATHLAALRSAIELGYTLFDTAESYADGHCEELLGRAIRESGVDRAGLFLTSKVKAQHLGTRDLSIACEGSLRRLGTDHLDLYLIHWPSYSVPLEETFAGLNRLVESGKVRHLGVSNFDLSQLKHALTLAATPLLTDQIPFSLVERSYAQNGVVEFCQANDILVTVYSPLEQKELPTGEAVSQVARARSLSAHQVAIAWLCSQPRVITIPMSAQPKHQRENLEAADVMLSPAELESIG
jgi:diketogulonate reductase-like aldo/keto reductase